MLKEQNSAEQKLIVGSLTVLSDIKNSGIQKLESTVSEIENEQTTIKIKQDNYWKDLSSDGKLTAVEKKRLRTKLAEETVSYVDIIERATKANCQIHADISVYKLQFEVFKATLENVYYINEDSTTDINKSVFDKVFSDYYIAKDTAQERITITIADTNAHNAIENKFDEELKKGDRSGFYLGAISVFPPTVSFGCNDWFTWGADNKTVAASQVADNKLIKGHVYKCSFINNTPIWTELKSDNILAARELTAALGDILQLCNATGDAYYNSVFCKSLLTQKIMLPREGVVYAGDFNAQDVLIPTTETLNGTTKTLSYNIREGGIPKGKQGFALTGTGEAAFSGIFRGDFYSDLVNIEKKSVNENKRITATAGENIFDVVQRIAKVYGTEKAPVKSGSLTFDIPQTFNGVQVKKFSWSIIEETQTEHDTGRIYSDMWETTEEREIHQGEHEVSYTYTHANYTDYEYFEYTTVLRINGKSIIYKRRECKKAGSGTESLRCTIEWARKNGKFSNKNAEKIALMQKGNVYTNETDFNLTDAHLLTGAVDMALGTLQPIMHFTDSLKNDNIGLTQGDVYQDGGFLKIVTDSVSDSSKSSNYQSSITTKSGDTGQYYSLNYFVLGDLLLYFGETTEHDEDTSVLIKFAPYTYDFKPICVTGNIQGNKWNKTNIVDLTTTYLRLRSFTPKSGASYSGKCSFLVIGKKKG